MVPVRAVLWPGLGVGFIEHEDLPYTHMVSVTTHLPFCFPRSKGTQVFCPINHRSIGPLNSALVPSCYTSGAESI